LRLVVEALAVSTSHSFPSIILNVETFQFPHSLAETGLDIFCVVLLIITLTAVPPATTFLPEAEANIRLISTSRFVSYVQVVLCAALAPN
jgi:hypothetical protein